MNNKFQSRKFWLSVGCVIIFTLLLTFDKMDDSVYENLVMTVVMAYIAGNITQKAILKDSENNH